MVRVTGASGAVGTVSDLGKPIVQPGLQSELGGMSPSPVTMSVTALLAGCEVTGLTGTGSVATADVASAVAGSGNTVDAENSGVTVA